MRCLILLAALAFGLNAEADPPKAASPLGTTPSSAPEPAKPRTQAEIEQDAKAKAEMKAATDAVLAEFGVKSGTAPGAKPKAKAGPTPPTPPKAPVKPTVTMTPSGG